MSRYPKHLLAAGVAIAVAATAAWTIDLQSAAPTASDAGAVSLEAMNIQQASLAFEPNQGQTASHVQFVARGEGYGLFLTPTEAVFSLSPGGANRVPGQSRAPVADRPAPAVLRMSVVGGNPDAVATGESLQAGTSHYITGKDPASWRSDVPRYGQVRYQDVYDGIDLVYYGNKGKLEYDFIVAPGQDPGQIAVDFKGVDGLSLDKAGNLVLKTAHGDLLQHKPVVYQKIDGVHRVIEGAYALLSGNRIGFTLGDYDLSLPLVIDPVLSYSTYLGGDGWDSTAAIGVDAAGNTYVAGNTNSIVFPWDMGNDSEFSGVYDAYVCRFGAVGGKPYCAYIGGSGDDAAWGLAIGPDGNAYVGGYTDSMDFPVLNASQPALAAGTYGDGFLLKINDQGNALEFSTYYGGNDSDVIRGVAVDSAGAAYITGNTWSWQNFPVTAGVLQPTDRAGVDAFVAKFSNSGARVFSTYLGGTAADQGRGITVDKTGSIYVSGYTDSVDFPIKSAVQPVNAGGGDAFIAKLNSTGTSLLYGTYHGGAGLEWGYDIRLDKVGNMLLVGNTGSADLPVTAGSIQGAFGGVQDGFLVKVNAAGSQRLVSTYFGGSGSDDMRHLALDPAGNLYWAGYVASTDFPLKNSHQPLKGSQDAVLVRLDATGKKLLQSTALGGSNWDLLAGVAVSLDGVIHLTGYTNSTNFPLAAAFQGSHASPPDVDEATPDNADIFLTRMTDATVVSWWGDFDADGTSDILWRNQTTGASIIWPSANSAQARSLTTITNRDWYIVGVGDFDGAGGSDILWRNAVTGGNTIWRNGNYSSAQSVAGVTNTNWKVAGLGDFNNDGKDDILWRESVTGANTVWLSANSATQMAVTDINNLAWEVVGVRDFNGDDRSDILWRNTATGQGVIWNSGSYASQQRIDTVAGTDWRPVGLDDFNDDNRDDILWRNAATGANLIWRSGLNSTRQAVSTVANQAWQVASLGDYDGDFRADILWRNRETGQNTIWRGGSSASVRAVTGVSNQDWQTK